MFPDHFCNTGDDCDQLEEIISALHQNEAFLATRISKSFESKHGLDSVQIVKAVPIARSKHLFPSPKIYLTYSDLKEMSLGQIQEKARKTSRVCGRIVEPLSSTIGPSDPNWHFERERERLKAQWKNEQNYENSFDISVQNVHNHNITLDNHIKPIASISDEKEVFIEGNYERSKLIEGSSRSDKLLIVKNLKEKILRKEKDHELLSPNEHSFFILKMIEEVWALRIDEDFMNNLFPPRIQKDGAVYFHETVSRGKNKFKIQEMQYELQELKNQKTLVRNFGRSYYTEIHMFDEVAREIALNSNIAGLLCKYLQRLMIVETDNLLKLLESHLRNLYGELETILAKKNELERKVSGNTEAAANVRFQIDSLKQDAKRRDIRTDNEISNQDHNAKRKEMKSCFDVMNLIVDRLVSDYDEPIFTDAANSALYKMKQANQKDAVVPRISGNIKIMSVHGIEMGDDSNAVLPSAEGKNEGEHSESIRQLFDIGRDNSSILDDFIDRNLLAMKKPEYRKGFASIVKSVSHGLKTAFREYDIEKLLPTNETELSYIATEAKKP